MPAGDLDEARAMVRSAAAVIETVANDRLRLRDLAPPRETTRVDASRLATADNHQSA
jgi:hypothetical protein